MQRVTFMINSDLSKKKTATRLSSFVLVAGVPRFKTKHSGVIDELDLTTPMDTDYKELIELGEATIETISKTQKREPCPRVLFFCSPSEGVGEGDPRLEKAYAPHLLSTYVKEINAEKQHPLEIHIAAHGNPENIGYITIEHRYNVDLFTFLLDDWFKKHLGDEITTKLKATGFNKKPIFFTFHSCNSAWAPTTPGMTQEMIEEHILNHSFIGQFKQKMTELGYRNITVSGFRGFYTHAASHTGSFVFGAPTDRPAYTANKTQFFIQANNQVSIPTHPHFPVTLPGYPNFRFFSLNPIRDGALAPEARHAITVEPLAPEAGSAITVGALALEARPKL